MPSTTAAARAARAAAHNDHERPVGGNVSHEQSTQQQNMTSKYRADSKSLDSGTTGRQQEAKDNPIRSDDEDDDMSDADEEGAESDDDDSDREGEDDEDEDAQDDDASDDDEDDEDEQDEEDDESESAEDEPVEEENHGFDEKFLAQLMAMDQMFAPSSLNGSTALAMQQSSDSQNFAQPGQPSMAGQVSLPFLTGTPSHADNAAGTQAPPLSASAPTPSNEFYDGAITFLTEVLGSSNPNLFNSAGTPSQGWTPNYAPLTGAGASPAPTATQFKNLQPLITNLIARLKGQPVEDGTQPHRISEEDLVVLLQSLMTQRQAQLEKKAQNGLTWPADQSEQLGPGHTIPYNNVSNANVTSSMVPATFDSLMPGQTGVPQGPGQSIVDFDFGDDDDDPDFVPSNWNLGYGNSAEFAQAFASVGNTDAAAASNGLPQKGKDLSEEECWQKVLDEFAPTSSSDAQVARGARDSSKNGERSTPKASSSAREARDASSEVTEGESKAGNQSKRKKYTEEEALERRRKVNRDCARRNRERKKQEAEELRSELERIEKLRAEGHPIDGDTINLTAPLIQPRRPGRPPGAKNRHDDQEQALSAAPEQKIDYEEYLDMRAENRMLRSEMQRLTEENAQLRARIMRYDDVFRTSQPSDLRKRKRNGEYAFDDDEADELSGRARSNTRQGNIAEEYLAYNPFRDLHPEAVRSADRRGLPRGHSPSHSELARTYSAPAAQREQQLSDRKIADVAAELVSNPKAVERLVATLKQQSNGAGSSTRQRHDDVGTSRRRGVRRSPSSDVDSYDGSVRQNTSSALQSLLRAAAATEHM